MILTFLGLLFMAGVDLPSLSSGAVVMEDKEVFRMTSTTSGELSVSKTVLVLDEQGLSSAVFYLYCDTFRSLKSFSGTVQASGQPKPKKLKKDDLYDIALSEGLVDDGKRYVYEPEGHYPLTVHYEYKVSYQKGISTFPVFFPLNHTDEAVLGASYTLDVPEGYAIKSLASGVEYAKETAKGRDLHTWTLKSHDPIVSEDMMPPIAELLPYVYCSPEELNLAGYKGMQRDWKELGEWVWNLLDGTGELSEEEIARVHELTAGCKTDFEKLSTLYAYLRERTRYVSIQLGIGGLKPIKAKEVSRMGFGDCKGLSRYLQSLLAAVGVNSTYYLINTSSADVLPGYASTNQFDHVMLAVPMKELSDTVWVECTNPSYPLGYRHESAAGHEVVLVKETGGELVRIPAYADTLSQKRRYADIVLDADGTAQMDMRLELCLDLMESYLNMKDWREDDRKKRLAGGICGNPWGLSVTGVTDNFSEYQTKGRDFVPRMEIDYSLVSTSYANVNGNRIFVPINPYPKATSLQKGKRHNEVYRGYGLLLEDIVTLHIPDGYAVESLPSSVDLNTEWGQFSSKAELMADGKTIRIRQTLTLHPFRAPASSYSSYADYFRKVNRQYVTNLVLTKQ